MNTLEQLGWSQSWSDRFAPFSGGTLVPARIAVEHREVYHYCSEHGEGAAEVCGRLIYEARSRADFPAVGDWVVLQKQPGANLASIQAVLDRSNRFSRKAPGKELNEQIVAANIDTLFVVTSLNRELNLRRIERYLAASAVPNLRRVVVLTKVDLWDNPNELLAPLAELPRDIPLHTVSAFTGQGLETLAPYLGPGQTVALVGSSGVGKSTLLNRLLGHERQEVREIRMADDRGRHTTTRRELIPLPQGGMLIDTPGMRELQLWDDSGSVEDAFSDIAALTAACRFTDCQHQQEPGCAINEALERGELSRERLASYHKLSRELEYQRTLEDPAAARERKEHWKRIHRIHNKVYRKREKR